MCTSTTLVKMPKHLLVAMLRKLKFDKTNTSCSIIWLILPVPEREKDACKYYEILILFSTNIVHTQCDCCTHQIYPSSTPFLEEALLYKLKKRREKKWTKGTKNRDKEF